MAAFRAKARVLTKRRREQLRRELNSLSARSWRARRGDTHDAQANLALTQLNQALRQLRRYEWTQLRRNASRSGKGERSVTWTALSVTGRTFVLLWTIIAQMR